MQATNQNLKVNNIITRDFATVTEQTGNIYETVAIISKRARQIALHETEELHGKLTDFATTDLEDLYDEERSIRNEQAEITKLYEKLPSPCIMATTEFLDKKLRYRYTS
jgi:DNA-directed RNA polymerase subunit K/omega